MSNPNRFKIYKKSNVVVDLQNCLMWQRDIRIATWEEADKTAKLSNSSGFSDWRLPTIEELQTLLEGIPEGQTEGEFLKGKGEYGFYWSRGLWNLEWQRWADSFFWSSSDYDEWKIKHDKEKTRETEENESEADKTALTESERVEFKAGIFFSSGKIGCRCKDSESPKYYFCVRDLKELGEEIEKGPVAELVLEKTEETKVLKHDKNGNNDIIRIKPVSKTISDQQPIVVIQKPDKYELLKIVIALVLYIVFFISIFLLAAFLDGFFDLSYHDEPKVKESMDVEKEEADDVKKEEMRNKSEAVSNAEKMLKDVQSFSEKTKTSVENVKKYALEAEKIGEAYYSKEEMSKIVFLAETAINLTSQNVFNAQTNTELARKSETSLDAWNLADRVKAILDAVKKVADDASDAEKRAKEIKDYAVSKYEMIQKINKGKISTEPLSVKEVQQPKTELKKIKKNMKATDCERYFRNSGRTWCYTTGIKATWTKADGYCTNIEKNSETGWRLPFTFELEWLKDSKKNMDGLRYWCFDDSGCYWDRYDKGYFIASPDTRYQFYCVKVE